MDAKRYALLDTNVLIDYYARKNLDGRVRNVHSIMSRLTRNPEKVKLYISNVCVAEVFKVLANNYIYPEDGRSRIDVNEYWKYKRCFGGDITRSYKYDNFPKYYQFDLRSHHIVHCDFVFKPAMELLKRYHETEYEDKKTRKDLMKEERRSLFRVQICS